MGRSLLQHKVRGIHSISAYVQAIMRRDFQGDQRTNAIAEAIIPSFREDDADQHSSADAQIQSYLDRLPTEKFILYVGALRRVKGVSQLLTAYARLGCAAAAGLDWHV